MTRRDFIAIAADIRTRVEASTDAHERSALLLLAQDLCVTLRAANARFDRARFLTACGF